MMPLLSDPSHRQSLRLRLLAGLLAGLLVVPGAARAQIFEDEEAYESSDEEMEAEENLFGFPGQVPPSIRRNIEAGERLADEAEDEVSEELSDEGEDD
jgi:hypothetical protein